jgi:hypothetical protein
MEPSALELFSTCELVDELMRRRTFLGVVIHSEEELKGEWKGERTFQVHFNENLNAGQATRLLEAIVDYMEEHQDS